jgi:hypothetical protein
MFRKFVTSRALIPIILCIQVAPLLVFPKSSYSLTTQEWWLPAFLSLLTLISLVQLLLRRSLASWPWYLLSFSQGFNIISRVMMLFPHATSMGSGSLVVNSSYLVITFAAIAVSAFEIWYCDLPEVRQKLASRTPIKTLA